MKVRVNEDKLAELIRKANKYNWLKRLGAEDVLSEHKGISLMDYTDGDYYQYDDMPIYQIMEDVLPDLQ